jgi:hypothetical protein
MQCNHRFTFLSVEDFILHMYDMTPVKQVRVTYTSTLNFNHKCILHPNHWLIPVDHPFLYCF